MAEKQQVKLDFASISNEHLASLCGPCNDYLKQIESFYGIDIHQRGCSFCIVGEPLAVSAAEKVLKQLYQLAENQKTVTMAMVEQLMHTTPTEHSRAMSAKIVQTRFKTIKPSNPHQQAYVDNIRTNDINFAIGPAGTGKTYLAVACAVEAFEKGHVQRLIFVRPAVEAGEKLGFLPGDLQEKVLPYLRPLYDALYEMLGFEQAQKLIDKNIIEIAPLAFMRGRTLSEAFIILDEAQNTTSAQMKMFLTRLGYGSRAVATGDISQIDLPHHITSGLEHAITITQGIKQISVTRFDSNDIVRNPLVTAIVNAYDRGGKP